MSERVMINKREGKKEKEEKKLYDYGLILCKRPTIILNADQLTYMLLQSEYVVAIINSLNNGSLTIHFQ